MGGQRTGQDHENRAIEREAVKMQAEAAKA